MEIINLKDFYAREEKEVKDISLYFNYLVEIKKELKERLEDVLLLELSDNIANDIRKQIKFVDGLESVINNSYNEIMILSVANFSDEELRTIAQKYLDVELKKQEEIKEQLESKYYEKELDETANRESFYKHGYDDSFYQAKDTDIFFRDIVSTQDYVKYLITSNMSREELNELFSLIPISVIDCNILSEMIIKLRKIVDVTNSGETLNEVVASFLSMNGMGKLENIKSVDECMGILEDLQKNVRLDTVFFACLPDNLKEDIKDEGFDVEGTYGNLLEIYEDYKKNGTVTMPVGAYSKSYDKSIKELESKLVEEQKRVKDLEEHISNREKLIEIIQDNLKNNEDGGLSLEQMIKNRDEHDKVRADLSRRIQEFENKKSELKSIISDINGVVDDNDFEIIQARNCVRMMSVLGNEATEDSILPYFEAETRRLKQYRIVVDTIEKLNEIKEQIDVIDGSRNIFKNISGFSKNEKNKLLELYKETCQKCYTKLEKEGLLRIVVGETYFDKQSEVLDKPLNFDELFNREIAPKYTLTYQNYQELKSRKCISDSDTFEEMEKLFRHSYVLGINLFTAKKRSDGVFEFVLYSKRYLSKVLEVQEILAHIYSSLYAVRKEERENLLCKSRQPLSKAMVSLIKKMNIGEGEVSREALLEYKRKLEDELNDTNEIIETLNSSLAQNEELVGVSMEDVDAYYSLLEGFYETIISTEEMKSRLL